jgi:GNAT superfamily N-acetyltransferase
LKTTAYRQNIRPSDPDAISEIVKGSGFFSAAEEALARELAEEKLEQGEKSSYQFLFAEEDGLVVGYTCCGLIPATAGSYDLYWIAVAQSLRGGGTGSRLLEKTEEMVRNQGGRKIYAETSSRPQYKPTRHFYEKCGYVPEAFLRDFYSPGDSKIIYAKTII